MKVRNHRLERNANLSLFEWADDCERDNRMSMPSAWVQRRYRLSPRLARTISELAGVGRDRVDD